MRTVTEAIGEMFRGLRPSKQAAEVVGEALKNGVDPSFHVGQAVEQANKKGKRKVCVRPGSPLSWLKEEVLARKAGR